MDLALQEDIGMALADPAHSFRHALVLLCAAMNDEAFVQDAEFRFEASALRRQDRILFLILRLGTHVVPVFAVVGAEAPDGQRGP